VVGGIFMTNIVLMHGTWCDRTVWGEFVNELEKLGLNVYTPTLRYHDLPYEEVEKKVADVSLDEFTDDIVDLIEMLDEVPIVLGHSLGGLLAQKVAMKTKTKGIILMGTAPAAGIFAFYPSMVICFYKHFLRWGFWKKSMPPYKHAFYDYCMNNQDEEDKEREFAKLVPESGFTYFQMALPFLDKQKGTYVDFDKIKNNPDFTIIGHAVEEEQGNYLVLRGSNDLAELTAQGWDAYLKSKKKTVWLWWILELQLLVLRFMKMKIYL